jgi:hypothetical protein
LCGERLLKNTYKMAYEIKSGDTLSKLAQTNNTTVQNLLSLNPNITDPNKIYAGQSLNLQSNVIPASGIAPVTPLKLTTPQIDPSFYNASGVIVDLTNQANTAQSNVDAINEKAKAESGSKAMLESLMGGKAEETNQLYNSQGVNDLYNQLKDYVAQSAALQSEAQLIPSIIQENNKNTGATDMGVAPATAGALRQNAIKQFGLAQSAAILSGQYEKAKTYADQIITAKYAQIEADIKAKQTNLEALKDFSLTPAQEKLKTAQENLLKRQEQEVAQKKADDTKMNDTLFKAMQGGAPKELTSAIQKAINEGTATVSQVNQMLAEYTLNLPASAQEYQFAVRNGYKGTFSQYQNEDANRKARAAQSVGNVGKVDFTSTEQKNYEAFKSEIDTYSSKQEALKDLEVNKSAVITKIGQAGYDLLVKDINSAFSFPTIEGQTGPFSPDYISKFLFE